MPGFNRRDPRRLGPQTGRGLGPCGDGLARKRGPFGRRKMTQDEEKEVVKEEIEMLEEELDIVKKELADLEVKAPPKIGETGQKALLFTGGVFYMDYMLKL